MNLSENTRKKIFELQKLYPLKRSALIPALHLAQEEAGYLPKDIQEEVASMFGIDRTEVNAIVTFYDMFFDKPVGKNVIHVCKNASCMLLGCDAIMENLCQKLKIQPGETTADGQFTVIPAECLGACDLAPMMIVNETVVGPLKEEDLDRILREAKHG